MRWRDGEQHRFYYAGCVISCNGVASAIVIWVFVVPDDKCCGGPAAGAGSMTATAVVTALCLLGGRCGCTNCRNRATVTLRWRGLFYLGYRKRLVWAALISQFLSMARYRSFLFPESTLGEGFLVLDPRESHHLVRVFRAKVGATIEVLDGRGRRYFGTIEIANGKAVRVAVDSVEERAVLGPRVTLLQSMTKPKPMDLILRMATEIGASVIQLVVTDQSERVQVKLDKWQLTMIEACKQCGLSFVPQLVEPIALRDWLQRHAPADQSLRVVASLEAGSRPLAETLHSAGALDEVIVAVGPPGDFSAEEYELLRGADFKAVRLGANVLRAETAAAYILSVVDQVAR